jgi:ATP-dependent DNA helicase RecQ
VVDFFVGGRRGTRKSIPTGEIAIVENIRNLLRTDDGYADFRPGQAEIIGSLLKGTDTLAVMPTGAGKSLCYQLPALALPGTAIVISPLISLMKDQLDALQGVGIPATYINSSLTGAETGEACTTHGAAATN